MNFKKKSIQTYLIIGLLFCSILSQAQLEKGRYMMASVGLGISSPDDESKAGGTGFYAQGEYIFALRKWLSLRPYAGYINTNRSNETKALDQMGYEVTTRAFFMGGKARLLAPIPYVAPFIESGLGVSIGSFKTHTEFNQLNKSGVVTHIPFTLGLALGKKGNIELAFTYQFHQSVQQYSGAAAIGYTFALD